MERGDRMGGLDGLLPRGAEPCVWMSAGLVAYKLCDRDFECDDCPFDRALRGAEPAVDAERLLPAGTPWSFPDDRRYHRGHTWSLPLADATVRVGVDAFAARLLGQAGSVVLPAVGSRLTRGQPESWFLLDAELIGVRAPVSGTVRRRNGRLQRCAGLLAHSPYDEGWLLEVVPAAGEAEPAGAVGGEAAGRRAERDMGELLAAACRGLAGRPAEVGQTLQDGGERIGGLAAALGAGAYARLVARFLS